MRGCPCYDKIPVLIISGSMPGYGDFPPRETYQDIIAKPFDLNNLLTLVESRTQ